MRAGRRVSWAIVLLSLVVGAALGFLVGPERQRLGEASAGDADLGARARAVLGEGSGLRSVVVAEVTASSIRWAGLGNAGDGRRPGNAPDGQSRYELGSITKTFTAALFADAIERGEVRAADTLATHLTDLRGTPAGSVTLGALAQHRSGLPGLGATAQAGVLSTVFNDNPYATTSTEQLIADASSAPVAADQPPTYSNFGFALLGTALVRAAGVADYPALVAQRITGPLGMAGTIIAGTDAEVPPGAVRGFTANGLATPRWTGTGYLPAGSSTFTTVADLARWAQAQLTGRAPGATALEPTAEFADGSRIGWAWITTSGPGDTSTTWHNGGTAGFRTMLALDRDAGRAVLIMGNTDTDLDAYAAALLHGTGAEPPTPSTPILVFTGVTVLLALLCSLVALRQAARGDSILPAVNALLVAAFGVLLAWTSGPWMVVGGWLWGLVLGPALAAVVLLGRRWRSLPLMPERRRWLAWITLAVGVALIALAAALW